MWCVRVVCVCVYVCVCLCMHACLLGQQGDLFVHIFVVDHFISGGWAAM